MTDKELRELDAWIAEHVMGWITECHEDRVLFFPPDLDTEKKRRKWSYGISINRYTTDPAAAMMVLEKCIMYLSDKFGSVDLDHHGKFEIAAMMRGEYAADTENDVDAETLPLAICLFAKKLFSK